MYKRILLPLDGSERAERALPVVARIAQSTGGRVFLVRVISCFVATGPRYAPLAYAEIPLTQYIEAASAYLAAIAGRPELQGIETERVVLFGAPADEILGAAKGLHADSIVLCSHGHSELLRWPLGGVAQKVVRHAQVPVLVVRAESTGQFGTSGDTNRPVRALVALDGSTFAEEALGPAAQLVTLLSAPAPGALHLVQVLDPFFMGTERGEPVLKDQDTRNAERVYAEGYLRAVAERCQRDAPGTVDMTWSVVVDGDVAAALCAIVTGNAEQHASDLLVLASHGRGGVRRWMLGSVAERVLHSTELAVLIVHPMCAAVEDTAADRFAHQAQAEITHQWNDE